MLNAYPCSSIYTYTIPEWIDGLPLDVDLIDVEMTNGSKTIRATGLAFDFIDVINECDNPTKMMEQIWNEWNDYAEKNFENRYHFV
jgi:hypothetical protein